MANPQPLGEVVFGPWAPDQYSINSEVLTDVTNALPGANSWHPFPSLEEIGQALSEEVRGAIVLRKSDNSTSIYAGTATNLYRYAGIGTAWTDVTRSSGGDYSLPDNSFWDFTPYGDQLVACQGGDAAQVIDIDSGTNFAALSADAPVARHAAFVHEYLVLYDLVTGVGSPANPRAQFVNSGFRNPTAWTYGQNSAAIRTFLEGGPIHYITKGRVPGLMIQENSVRSMVPSPGDEIWNIRTIEELQGTASPYSVIEHKGHVFYLAKNGFVSSSPGAYSSEVGIEWIDEWFFDNVNTSRIGAVQGALDPTRPRYFWLAPSTGNTSNVFDILIGFDPIVKKWFKAEVEVTCIAPLETPATTLGDLGSGGLGYTLGTMPAPFGSAIFKGGAPRIGAFSATPKMGFFSGSALEALFVSGRVQFLPGRRTMVNGIRLQTNASGAVVRQDVSENAFATMTEGAEQGQTDKGFVPMKQSGRYHRLRTRIPAGEDWTDIRAATLDKVSDAGDL